LRQTLPFIRFSRLFSQHGQRVAPSLVQRFWIFEPVAYFLRICRYMPMLVKFDWITNSNLMIFPFDFNRKTSKK
jgi:hypothetical protein